MKALESGLPSASETQLAILTIVKGRARVHWSQLSPDLPATWRSESQQTRYETLLGGRCR